MANRTNKVILVVGARNTGKSNYMKDMLVKMYGNFPKCLVVDTFDSPVWHDLSTFKNPTRLEPIPILKMENLKAWKKGIARMFSKDVHGMLNNIAEYAKDTFIVFEDSRKMIKSNLPKNVEEFVIDSKQKNLDLVFVFHSLRRVPPGLIDLADILILFKTNENKVSEDKYPFPEIPGMIEKLQKRTDRYTPEILLLN